MKKLFVLLIGISLAGVLVWRKTRPAVDEAPYRFVEITRGDLEQVVASTGTLQATRTVEVGTQVSGKVAEILADFNDHVEEGELVARIDPTLLRQEVRSVEASLERAEADRNRARREVERVGRLGRSGVLARNLVDDARSSLEVAEAGVKSAQVGLERARQNLAYSDILSPIDGVVVDRLVDVGQTVAASLSAPRLFLIAEDLSRMQILVSVDESDIGEIHVGQEARFTVQAQPEARFVGEVSQVRLQSRVAENVVSYTVVVDVENADGRLLPGMTATVDFLVARAEDVLKVANSALRLRPTDEMRAAFEERGKAQRAARDGQDAPGGAPAKEGGPPGDGWTRGPREGDKGPRARQARGEGGGRDGGGARGTGGDREGGRERPPLLWFVEPDGRVNATRVVTSISDGQETQVEGKGITEGMQVIASVISSTPAPSASPFQTTQRPGGGGGRFPPGPPGS